MDRGSQIAESIQAFGNVSIMQGNTPKFRHVYFLSDILVVLYMLSFTEYPL